MMAIKEGWTGRVFEDFEVGDVFRHALGRTLARRRGTLRGGRTRHRGVLFVDRNDVVVPLLRHSPLQLAAQIVARTLLHASLEETGG